MIHRYLAGGLVFLLAAFVLVAWRSRRQLPWAAPVAVVTGSLYVAQVLVGALNVWYIFPDLLTVSHTALASGVWLALSSALMLAYYVPAAERRRGAVAEVPA